MTTQAAPMLCRLTAADGTVLGTGQGVVDDHPDGDRLIVMALDTPGTLVARCLLGPVREVLVSFDGGEPCAARVERVFFHPRFGRACALRVPAEQPSEEAGRREDQPARRPQGA